jgi:hypothetical protein|nr:MAG TPA: hypothetical protein [Bacteriophage sp.]
MNNVILSDSEARRLLEMIKVSLKSAIDFPSMGKETKFEVKGDTSKDVFTINIYRSKYNQLKYNYGALVKKNGIMILKLHISPSKVHQNPDGAKIIGSHWHIYILKSIFAGKHIPLPTLMLMIL